jgi:GT2 family glycosyltransferase
MSALTRVTVQVVLYESLPKLPLLLGGLRAMDLSGLDLTLRLFDNSPGSATEALVGAHDLPFPSEYVASAEGNIGFGRAHNRLAAGAGLECEYLLLLNPDALPFDDMLVRLIDAARANPRAAMVEAAQFPVEHQKAFDLETLHTDWCCAAALLMRTRAFQKLGGFDERLFLYCEDVDLSWRAWLTGYECIYVPGAKTVHVSQEDDLGKDRSAEIGMMEVGNLFLRSKYFGAAAVADHVVFLRSSFPDDLVDEILDEFARIACPRPLPVSHRRLRYAEDHVNYGPVRWRP